MELPIVAALLGAFLLVLQQIMMLSVGMHRASARIGVGVASDRDLERKVRRHGNLAENAGIFVVVLALAEMAGMASMIVAAFASAFALARVMHGIGFLHLDGSHNPDGQKFWIAMRAGGSMVSALGGISLGLYLAYLIVV